jgi:hypothetical protein
MKKIYFAHCMKDYGNAREQIALGLIAERFPEAQIVNPTEYQVDFNMWRNMTNANGENPMIYWTDLVRGCDALVFLWSEDMDGENVMGAGVAQEVLTAHVRGTPVFQIYILDEPFGGLEASLDVSHVFSEVLTIDETRTLIARPTEPDQDAE